MGQIFVSYSRRDTEMVDRTVDLICKAGLDVWLDRHKIRAGNQWRVQIVQAIDTCDAFVLMLSPNSAASDNVRKEIDLAQDSGRTIFVFTLEPVKLPAEIRYQLAGLQFLDVNRLGFEEAVKQLNDTLKENNAALQAMKEPAVQRAEVVIRGIDLNAFGAEKKEQLLNFIAQLTDSNPSMLSIAGMAAGSVHVFIDMPPEKAYLLKTLALNQDKRFRQFGIISLRLAGDKKFINIALGILTATATIGFLQALWLGVPSLFLPVVGAAAGKVLTISLVMVVTIGLVVSAPRVITALKQPTPTNTITGTPHLPGSTLPVSQSLHQRYITSTVEKTMEDESAQKSAATNTPVRTETPSATATPQDPLVLVDTACFREPVANNKVVSHLDQGTRVKLVARSDDGMWWLVENPVYHSLCWVQHGDLQLDPAMNVDEIPIHYIFSTPTPQEEAPDTCTIDTPLKVDKECYCSWPIHRSGDPSCYGTP
jgi:hypothetical protein